MANIVHVGKRGPKFWASKGWKVIDAQPFEGKWIVTLEKQTGKELTCQTNSQQHIAASR